MKYRIDESKEEKFKRLAAIRTNVILEKLRILGNCANRNAYEYSKQDVEKIFDVIERKTKETKSKFYFPKEEKFKL